MNEQILDCGHAPSEHSEHTTGYGVTMDGKTACYACCAEDDKRTMDKLGKYTLYLVKREDVYYVTNWPASLSYRALSIRKSWHNMAGKDGRTDFWFVDHKGRMWHGYQIGQYNEIAHVKRVKA